MTGPRFIRVPSEICTSIILVFTFAYIYLSLLRLNNGNFTLVYCISHRTKIFSDLFPFQTAGSRWIPWHLPRTMRDLLMLLASSRVFPSLCVFFVISLPARSTKFIFPCLEMKTPSSPICQSQQQVSHMALQATVSVYTVWRWTQ